MTFESEEAKQAALEGLPDQPPPGTTDINTWLREVEDRKGQILTAEIVAAPKPEQTPTVQPPESQAQGPAPAEPYQAAPEPTAPSAPSEPTAPTASSDDEIIATAPDGTAIKRGDLPPDLKKYRNLQEILKTADHARRYANSTEKTVEQLSRELQERNKKLADLEARQQVQPPSQQQAPRPATPMAVGSDRKRLETAKETLKSLQSMDPSEIGFDPSKFNAMFARAIEAIEDVDVSHAGEVAELRRALDETRQEVKQVASRSDEVSRVIQEKEAVRAVHKRIGEFQDTRPELKTSKPVFAPEGQCVERDAGRFADAIILRKSGKPATNWTDRNRVINAYLRGDPDTLAFCEENGLSPERFDTSINDLRNYAICLNVDTVKKGFRIDEYTGSLVPITDFMGNQVSFPDHESAYEYLCRTSGITQRKRQEELQDAEKQGQQKLEAALHRAPVPSIGREGAGPRPAAADKMSPQDAMKMMSEIDVYEMHNAALRGDRRLFNLYSKCRETLGFPSPTPDPLWPKELMQAA